MKISVFKQKGNKETVVREEMGTIVEAISSGTYQEEVRKLREIYPLIHPRRTEDGQMETDFNYKMTLPRLCFGAEISKSRNTYRVQNYNGLIVLEANNLADYDEAIQIRDAAARLPQTILAFLGSSGRSVKIVCRGERYPDNGGGVPTEDEEIQKFHLSL